MGRVFEKTKRKIYTERRYVSEKTDVSKNFKSSK